MMKRLTLLLASLLACVCAWAGGIGSAKDFEAFIKACNDGESLTPFSEGDTLVVLTADIDLSKVKKLAQIEVFTGRFDGRGFRIKNWKNATAGLFKVVGEKAVVSHLIIDKSCTMKVNHKGAAFNVGFIADENNGTLLGCINEGGISFKCGFVTAPLNVGGIAGSNRYVLRDCRNAGKITADVISGDFKEENALNLGGIAGGATSKAIRGSVAVNCENAAEISVIGNLANIVVGGIYGNSTRTTLKYCVNRGKVTVELRKSEDGRPGMIREGGVVGQAKADILRCDNFGAVTAQGEAGAAVAGIAGVPHNILVIADCFNYGEVKALGEEASNAAGIAGAISRPVHIRGCVNYGKIVFDGISSRARSTAGGIVGSMITPKTQEAGAYVSRCINHGEIYAGSGGNKYDKNNRNAIHAGGVVAFAEIREGLRASVKDNFNDGKVTCDGGRKGSIAGAANGVIVSGSPCDDWAQVLDKPANDGSNVTGTVKTPEGQPLEGIWVTDGLQYVKTAADGSFKMTSDLSKTRFIYMSIPADARPVLRDGVPMHYRRVPRYAKAVRADLVLEKAAPVKDYTVLMIADPQVRPFGWDNSMERWHDTVAPDAEAFRASCSTPVYSINLGDLVYNEPSAWEDYLDAAAKVNCPTFNVIGNHDYDQNNLFDTNLGNIYFETYVGPEHYSFDLGDIHYVAVNGIMYGRKTPADKYGYGIDDVTLAWLKADLENVPKDKVIMTASHNNIFKTPNTSPHGSHSVYNVNYQAYLDLLSSYREVYAWNGHYHKNFYYNYANHFGKDTKHGAPNIQCISVARATGALRFNAPIGPFGDPQGYMVMNVKGDQVDWYYKSVGQGKDYQMRAYSPIRTGDGTVKVNIWNWSEGWSTPAWYENGVKVADMTFTPGTDPDYVALYDGFNNERDRKSCTPANDALIFSVTPSAGCTAGEIRVTDMFGNEYSQKVEWNNN
ncbi:MAG: calcineurin-like phosphoesterase family protein [Bacteroidales bacterium]|nr:calcineurin-like phosphoesterase family protein [Bacteroidales bacterium]